MTDHFHSSRFVEDLGAFEPPLNFEILYSPELAATYAQMKSEAEASAGTYGAALYNRLIARVAASPTIDSNLAPLAAIAYKMTGNSAYVATTLTRLTNWLVATSFDDNSIREHGAEKVFMLTWIWDGLTSPQKTQYLNQLDLMFADALAKVGTPASAPIRTTDSDQTTGVYFALAWYYLAFGNFHANAVTLFNHPQIGGLNATGLNLTTLRNAIAFYVDQAEGGEWVEGSSYNLGTVRLLLLGEAGVRHITGNNSYPEVTAWAATAYARYAHMITPDLVKSMQWGDVEEANIMEPWAHLSTAMLYDEPHARQLVYDLVTKYGMTGTLVDPVPMSYALFNPYGATTPSSDLPLIFDAHAGMGVVSARTSWDVNVHTHVMTQFPAYMFWDHGSNFSGDMQMYRNKEWALRHPISYSGPAGIGTGNNAMIHEGYGAPLEFRGGNSAYSGTGWSYTAGTVGGSIVASSYYQPPAVFWHEWSRSILWIQDTDADILIVFDRTHAFDPQTLANFTRYTSAIQSKIAAQPLRKWHWHSPIIPTIAGQTASWLTGVGTQTAKVTWLRSDFVASIIDEDVEYAPYNMNAAERDYHVRLTATPDVGGFETAAHVLEFGDPTKFATSITNVTAVDAKGVQIVRTGKFTIVALFNAIAGPTLANAVSTPTRQWNPANPGVLDDVRIRTTSVTYTPASGVHMWWPETVSGVLAEVIP